MTDQALISIIIPTYNRADLIGETLDSIMAQTHQNWECLIIDDRSTDNTKEVVERYTQNDNRFKYYCRPEHYPKGANICRNYGFELAKGDYINWFDSDDVVLNNFLELRLNLFQQNTLFVIGSYFRTDFKLENRVEPKYKFEESLLLSYIKWIFPILTPSILFRKSFLEEKKQLFDPEIRRGQETDFFIRLFDTVKEEDYIFTNTPLFLYRQHPDSKTGKSEEYVSEYIQSRIKTYSKLYFLAQKINNQKVKEFSYQKLMIDKLMESIRNQDKSIYKVFNSCFLNNTDLKELSLIKKLEIKFWYQLMFLTRKTPRIIENRIRKFI